SPFNVGDYRFRIDSRERSLVNVRVVGGRSFASLGCSLDVLTLRVCFRWRGLDVLWGSAEFMPLGLFTLPHRSGRLSSSRPRGADARVEKRHARQSPECRKAETEEVPAAWPYRGNGLRHEDS